MSVLVIDDFSETLELYKELLELQQFTVYTAKNGEQALRLLVERRPTLIIVDDDPAEFSAVALIALLKSQATEFFRHPPAAVAIRGDVTGPDDQVLVSFEHVLRKPLDFDALDTLVARYAKPTR